MTTQAQSILDEFLERYEKLAGKVTVSNSEEEAAAAIVDILRDKSPARVATAGLAAGILDALRRYGGEAGVEILAPPYNRSGLQDLIDSAGVGVSPALFAVAEVGAVAEMTAGDDMRLVSSLPDVHIALVRSGQILQTLKEAAAPMRAFLNENRKGATVTFISGPSRTGDIEMKLTLGVHGPKESYVVVIRDHQE